MRLRAGESHARYAGRCSTRCRGAEDTEPRVARPAEVLEEIEANAHARTHRPSEHWGMTALRTSRDPNQAPARRHTTASSCSDPVAAHEAYFERYLLAERALATGTVGGYVTLDQRLPILLWSDQLKY